jgi:pyrroloquinoline quinone (PQQ) biosynthesis protein C
MKVAERQFGKPRLRESVGHVTHADCAELFAGRRKCSFSFPVEAQAEVAGLLLHLAEGGRTTAELMDGLSNRVRDEIPGLLAELTRLGLVVESEPVADVCSGPQLYREIRRLCARLTARIARSSFYEALEMGRATRRQLVGYALEYFCLVRAAPSVIAPALATAHSPGHARVLEQFLASELGHDAFLRRALEAVEIGGEHLDRHQPLPSTMALIASLGVYARQDPVSFACGLFLFERAQPRFMQSFERRSQELGLPKAFCAPLRRHAELNAEHKHDDISMQVMEHFPVIHLETAVVAKRHVSLLLETMVWQEEEILDYYGSSETPQFRYD